MLQELIKKGAYSDILPTIDILKMKNNLEADMPDKPEKQEKKRKI